MILTHSYKQPFYPDSLAFDLAKESGRIYTMAMNLNKKEHKDFKEITKIMSEYVKSSKYLQSQSAQAPYENFIENLKSYFKSLKDYNKNPSKFSGKPRPPHKKKFMFEITFKKSAIRCKNGFILLSVKKPFEPIKLAWAKDLPKPIWVTINYDRFEGWNINFIMNKECKALALDKNKLASVDLGLKRVATTFDGKNTTTYSGKELMSLNRLRNKVDGRVKSRISKLKKKSRKRKIIQRAKRKIIKRIKNKEKDILHKYSRKIVNNAIDNNIGKIVIGNNSSTHDGTDLTKVQNQKIQQNPEQKLKRFIMYKFNSVSGETKVRPEPYTTRTCPKCANVKNSSPKGRTYSCSHNKCNFTFDRDGVGSINIYKDERKEEAKNKNVSFDHKEWLDVVGGLTPPIGVKYHKNTPRLSLVSSNRNRIPNSCLASNGENSILGNFSELVNSEKLEEPHVL